MDKETALRVFNALEQPRFVRHPMSMVSERPHFNVRLDAMTRKVGRRDFRLFVRIDDESPRLTSEDNLRFICEQAREHGLNVSIENGGVEVTD